MAFFDFVSKTSYTFEGKKEGEQVMLFLHRHWFTLAPKIFFACLASLAPLIPMLVFGQFLLPYLSIIVFLWSIYILILWFVIFYILTMYTLDYWIVTDERIVDSVQSGFFNRKVSELSLETIQDVSVTLKGVIPTTVNYGSVIIQTAGRENQFFFDQVPKPQIVKDTIMDLIDAIEARREKLERNPRTAISRL